ncbi:Phospholipase/carboxylesterase [Xylariaceae sp. AK1471]|nr:Phospholipase/carboxylesterase [Xylariaceae sp. AK1471]
MAQRNPAKAVDDLTSSGMSFGPVHVIHPRTEHNYTALVLHGRGSNGKEFAEEFLASTLSSGQSLPEKLPEWRWVFPTSPELWSTTFQEELPAWFEAHSLSDITARQELQVDGIRESVWYILDVLRNEIEMLHGESEKVVLGGISQGGAVGLWTLLCQAEPIGGILGGFFGASTWLPFASNVERVLASKRRSARGEELVTESHKFDSFVETMMESMMNHYVGSGSRHFTPVFLGHGVDDAYVEIELGRQAARVLRHFGLSVEWKEYSGAEEEGHWFKVPNEIDDIYGFLNHLQSLAEDVGRGRD